MRFFDSHTHVNLKDFSADQDETIQRALEANTWMVNVGTDLASSREAVQLADKFPVGVFATIGQHPTDSSEGFDQEVYSSLIGPKVVAVGECGLDYFHQKEKSQQDRQKTEFIKQIHFAQKHGLPLVIHCRDAYEDLIQILKAEYQGEAIIHSFTDSWETAQKFLALGYYIAFNGILTFDKTGKLAEVVEKMPFEKLLIETDAPFLTPPPFRGKRNEPSYVQYVAAKIAEIKGMSQEEVSEQTFQNACKFFGLKK